MPIYKAPLRDMNFVLFDVLGAERLATLPGYEEATPDMITAVLEEAAKGEGLIPFEASIVLKNWENGTRGRKRSRSQ